MASGYNAHLEVKDYAGRHREIDVEIPVQSHEKAYAEAIGVARKIVASDRDSPIVGLLSLSGPDGSTVLFDERDSVVSDCDHLTTLR